MDELIGLQVRIMLYESSGYISITGKVIKIADGFIVIEDNNVKHDTVFINLNLVKLINIIGTNDDEK